MISNKPVKTAIVPTAYTDNTGDPVHRFSDVAAKRLQQRFDISRKSERMPA